MSSRRQRGHKPQSLNAARCNRKSLTWVSERRALIGAQFVANRERIPMAVYQCAHCKDWHLSHKLDRKHPERSVQPHDALTQAIFEAMHGHRGSGMRKAPKSIFTPSVLTPT